MELHEIVIFSKSYRTTEVTEVRCIRLLVMTNCSNIYGCREILNID